MPNLKYVPYNVQEIYLDKMIKRFAYIKWTGVLVVAITGVVQWIDIYPAVANKGGYLWAFAIKMLGAIGLFIITFMLALPDERLKGMKKHRAFWAGLNIVCALTILIGAAMMRAIRNGQL